MIVKREWERLSTSTDRTWRSREEMTVSSAVFPEEYGEEPRQGSRPDRKDDLRRDSVGQRVIPSGLRSGMILLLLGWRTALAAQATGNLPAKPGEGTALPEAPSASLPQAAAGSQGQTEAERKASQHAKAEKEVKQEETQRLLVVVPNFNTVLSGRATPLDKGQKTELAVHATFDPFNFVSAVLLAGLSEYEGTERGYGWGPGGYFKRVGANLADVFDSTMLAGAVYPILLRQDPRYFRKATGPIKARIRHALFAPFVCLGDNGRPQPNYSNLLGNFTAGALSNVYYPAQDRGVSLSLINSSIVMVEGSLGNIGLEFAPDVEAYWKRRHHKDSLPPASDSGDAAPAPGSP